MHIIMFDKYQIHLNFDVIWCQYWNMSNNMSFANMDAIVIKFPMDIINEH